MTGLNNCKKFSELVDWVRVNGLSEEDFYKLAEPTMAGLERKGLLHMVSQYCEAHDLLLDTEKPYENRLGDLFDELVPSSDKADSVAGELVRAASRIAYRYYNDGDMLDVGYGRETCNPAGRFLSMHGDENIRRTIDRLGKHVSEERYEVLLQDLIRAAVDYIEAHPELKNEETEDMFKYFDPKRDFDDEDDEDEYE